MALVFFEEDLRNIRTDVARELDVPLFGPVNVWYKNHKDGLMGVLLTILIEMLTTILTNKYFQ